mmetsp:Transcript_34474/g.72579  ORF Transcript_34474/g.72579 Transcript_34474/m.72579 type:complete len:267 (+) Transcript_34474:2429-3229(+)
MSHHLICHLQLLGQVHPLEQIAQLLGVDAAVLVDVELLKKHRGVVREVERARFRRRLVDEVQDDWVRAPRLVEPLVEHPLRVDLDRRALLRQPEQAERLALLLGTEAVLRQIDEIAQSDPVRDLDHAVFLVLHVDGAPAGMQHQLERDGRVEAAQDAALTRNALAILHRFVLLLDCRANELHVALLLDDAPLGLLLRDPFEKGGGECLAGNRPNPLRPRWRPTREFVRRLVGLIAATAAPSLASARSHAGRRLTASAQHPPVENLL